MIEIIGTALIILFLFGGAGFMIYKGRQVHKRAIEESVEVKRLSDMTIRALDHIAKGYFQTSEEKAENQRINELGRERWGKY